MVRMRLMMRMSGMVRMRGMAMGGVRVGREAKRPRPPSRRRSPEEIAALGERLYEAICRHPGETMAVIAPVVGASPGELRRPSVLLRREGRVRSVGQRHAMRYFPLDE